MRAGWGELMERSAASAFCRWEWLYPWYRRIGRGRELRLLVARDGGGGRLTGLLPLCEERRGGARRWAFLGETHVGSDGLDVVAERGREEEVAALFAAWLRERRGEWDVLDLVDLWAESPTVGVMRAEMVRAGMVVKVTDRHLCPFEEFQAGETFEGFLRKVGRRENYLRRRKWLQAQPGYRVEISERPGELASPMAEFFRLHAMRWAGEGGSQGIRGASVESFHRDATELLAETGRTRLYTMWVGDRAVASVYGIVDGSQFMYFQSGYDPGWRERSVGLVLVGETFRDAIERGVKVYDFLRGTERYKSDWVTRLRRTVAVRAFSPNGRGAWLDGQELAARWLRAAAKRVLPRSIVERIRRSTWIRQELS